MCNISGYSKTGVIPGAESFKDIESARIAAKHHDGNEAIVYNETEGTYSLHKIADNAEDEKKAIEEMAEKGNTASFDPNVIEFSKSGMIYDSTIRTENQSIEQKNADVSEVGTKIAGQYLDNQKGKNEFNTWEQAVEVAKNHDGIEAVVLNKDPNTGATTFSLYRATEADYKKIMDNPEYKGRVVKFVVPNSFFSFKVSENVYDTPSKLLAMNENNKPASTDNKPASTEPVANDVVQTPAPINNTPKENSGVKPVAIDYAAISKLDATKFDKDTELGMAIARFQKADFPQKIEDLFNDPKISDDFKEHMNNSIIALNSLAKSAKKGDSQSAVRSLLSTKIGDDSYRALIKDMFGEMSKSMPAAEKAKQDILISESDTKYKIDKNNIYSKIAIRKDQKAFSGIVKDQADLLEKLNYKIPELEDAQDIIKKLKAGTSKVLSDVEIEKISRAFNILQEQIKSGQITAPKEQQDLINKFVGLGKIHEDNKAITEAALLINNKLQEEADKYITTLNNYIIQLDKGPNTDAEQGTIEGLKKISDEYSRIRANAGDIANNPELIAYNSLVMEPLSALLDNKDTETKASDVAKIIENQLKYKELFGDATGGGEINDILLDPNTSIEEKKAKITAAIESSLAGNPSLIKTLTYKINNTDYVKNKVENLNGAPNKKSSLNQFTAISDSYSAFLQGFDNNSSETTNVSVTSEGENQPIRQKKAEITTDGMDGIKKKKIKTPEGEITTFGNAMQGRGKIFKELETAQENYTEAQKNEKTSLDNINNFISEHLDFFTQDQGAASLLDNGLNSLVKNRDQILAQRAYEAIGIKLDKEIDHHILEADRLLNELNKFDANFDGSAADMTPLFQAFIDIMEELDLNIKEIDKTKSEGKTLDRKFLSSFKDNMDRWKRLDEQRAEMLKIFMESKEVSGAGLSSLEKSTKFKDFLTNANSIVSDYKQTISQS